MAKTTEKEDRRVVDAVAEKVAAIANTRTTRRGFLKVGLGGIAISGLYLAGCASANAGSASPTAAARVIFEANATGMILHQSTLCVGCRRCEIACTDFNLGKTQPSIANIKVNRNYTFGPQGAGLGFWRGEGTFGNNRIIADTCKQCPHPVPCAEACPYNAIEVVAPTNARVVNIEKCKGCRTCQKACPWAMTSFDESTMKAQKCHLCNGSPECVKACPTGALSYVPWVDKTKNSPQRFVVPASIQLPKDVKDTCVECH
jgi:Fe-S-cluster-containing dehydrogenase component